MTFKLSFCGAFIIEDDGEAHPQVRTIADARGRLSRLEAQAAAYEREADTATRAGRTFDADTARAMASIHLTLATDLLLVLQGVETKVAA